MNALEKSDRLKLIVLATFAALALLTAASAFGQAASGPAAVMTELEVSRTKILSPAQQALQDRLQSVVLPEVTFEGVPLADVLKRLYDEATSRLPGGQRINFVFVPRLGPPVPDANAAQAVNLGPIPVTIHPSLKNVTLAEALEAVVDGAGHPVQMTMTDYAVVFSPKTTTVPPLFSRRFVVNPGVFLTNLLRASGFSTTNELIAFAQKLPPASSTNNPAADYSKALSHFLKSSAASTNSSLLQAFYNDRSGLVLVRASEPDLRMASAAILSLEPAATSGDWAKMGNIGYTTLVPTPEADLLPPANTSFSLRAATAAAPAPALSSTSMVTRVYYLGGASVTNQLNGLGFGIKSGATNAAGSVSAMMRELFVRLGAFETADPLVSVVVTNQALVPFTRLANGGDPITNTVARELLSAMGGRLITNRPPSPQVFSDDRRGLLMVRATCADFELIEPAIEFLTTPQNTLIGAGIMGLPPGPKNSAVLSGASATPAMSSLPGSLHNRFYQMVDRGKFVELIAPGAASLNRKQFENSLLRYFSRVGADFYSDQPDGKILIYDDLTNRILVRGTAGDLEIIERIIQTLNGPLPATRK